jgi:hypothetical protein
MAVPQYSPIKGYGSKANGYNYVQTPSGGQWSSVPASRLSGSTLGATAPTPKNNNKKTNDNTNDKFFDEQTDMTNEQFEQDYERTNNLFNYQSELLQGQEKELNVDKATNQSILEQALRAVLTTAGNTKENIKGQAEAALEQGGSAARQATTKSRNMLRGLGIMNSSAAGDILSRPGTEFQKVSANINEQLSKGLKEVDDYIMAKTEENATKVQQLLSQYAAMVDRIKTDLRFNAKEKISALKQATLARDQTLSEIRARQTDMKLSAQSFANNLISSFSGVEENLPNIQDPSASIASTAYTTPQTQTQNPNIILPSYQSNGMISTNPLLSGKRRQGAFV